MRARAIVGRPSASSRPDASAADLRIDRKSELAEAIDGPGEPDAALIALGDHRGLERLVVRVHAEPEDVQLAFPQAQVARHEGVDLDARDERHVRRDGRRRIAVTSR